MRLTWFKRIGGGFGVGASAPLGGSGRPPRVTPGVARFGLWCLLAAAATFGACLILAVLGALWGAVAG